MFRFMLALLVSVGFLGQGFCTPAPDPFTPALTAVQNVLNEQQLLPPEYKYGVAGNSTLAIQNAVLTVMKANPKYLNGHDRRWVNNATAALSHSANNKQLQIYNVGYPQGMKIDPKIPLLVDAAWSATSPKIEFPQSPVGYSFSVSYLAYQPTNLSVAYFRDPELAQQVQKQLIYTGGSVFPNELNFTENFFQSSGSFLAKRDAVVKTANASFDKLNNQVNQFNAQNGANLQLSTIPSGLAASLEGSSEEMAKFKAAYPQTFNYAPSLTRNRLYSQSTTETRAFIPLMKK